ncbi:hypothetical protein B0T26DRAFT_727964 [Lasiosphaeria miniovina]|uniref:Kinase n=1 Tax=Lasiosphaeria miniovina TaxID=1954250 RepID=A0AA40A000_9PEZI|nr:uncharacterized protein B0T26DRAFT_727964 [Lasiosphaeria miniovina]KAK0706768.1 hypothetical protein B0T26DRAFT_727964 [Lasiosphaeria miniovina]
MSSPPSEPGNAATAAPVSPDRAAAAVAAAATTTTTIAGAGAAVTATPQPDDAPPAHAHAHAHAQQLDQAGAAPHHLGPLPIPPPVTPQPPLPAATATASVAAPYADQIKYPRGPVLPQRPHSHGPSLLTQALATARGIPIHSQAEPSHTKPQSTRSPPDQAARLASLDSPQPSTEEVGGGQDARHDSLLQVSGGVLTPRASSPPTAMHPPSTAAVSATVESRSASAGASETPAPTACSMLNLGEVNSMLNGHRDFLSKTKGRSSPLERTDREWRLQDRLSRSSTFPHDSATGSSHTSPLLTDSPLGAQDVSADEGALSSDGLARAVTWKPEHRVSMGPEKAWSISTGDLATGQEDGRVEKSIAEVISGGEANVRSRKASHRLGFFKEGLPEEKGKRKESRPGPHVRDKPLPIVETTTTTTTTDAQRQPGGGEGANTRTLAAHEDRSLAANSHSQVRAFTVRSPEACSASDSQQDYISSNRGPAPARDVTAHHAAPDAEPPCLDRQATEFGEDDADLGLEARRNSDDSVGLGECAEEGDESGEEKISSAVFLPHQGLEQSQDHAAIPGVPPRSTPAPRTVSRADDWLVKAGEPEVDQVQNADYERLPRPEPADSSHVSPKVDSSQVDGSAIADESDPTAYPPKPTRPLPQYHEDNVHEHQWAPKQPLEAIELIPYKHQVGGHTTLWRFSRRAVCKQLNNRENEFYEKVEKYHRDLLAFLPRYIGVLNVTFQKQPRRKSTLKQNDVAALERHQVGQPESGVDAKRNETARDEAAQKSQGAQASSTHQRVVSQSLQPSPGQIPTVTFVDNQHILPRNLLQPSPGGSSPSGRFRSPSAFAQELGTGGHNGSSASGRADLARPALQDRHANSWGATTVNKRLRNEVFNDAFLKQPIAIHRHKRGHQRPLPRTLQQALRSTGSDPSLMDSHDKQARAFGTVGEPPSSLKVSSMAQSASDLGQVSVFCEDDDEPTPADVTGTSAPEPEILGDASPAQKKKRRYSGTGLRRKPKDVRDARGDLRYYAEADDAGYKGKREENKLKALQDALPVGSEPELEPAQNEGNGNLLPDANLSVMSSAATSGLPSPTSEFKRIPRPVNPKEAQTQRDSRVEYFLLLEDLTAGMKRPCIMDLKMGTRQYGVDASPKKQKSQQGKCAKTTSRELGVRVCGLQVWDVKTQSYEFRDKYYGRDLKKGREFQEALTRFLYDGADWSSILRHIPTVLHKLDLLEVIIGRLRGYRFYAASLLMFYNGDTSEDYDTAVDDSTTDFATDTEETPRRTRNNPREIDFKIADFANCVTAGDLGDHRSCPPKHPNEPDRGFLRGLRSLRKYFLKIQRDTRAEMGMVGAQSRSGAGAFDGASVDEPEDDDSVSD